MILYFHLTLMPLLEVLQKSELILMENRAQKLRKYLEYHCMAISDLICRNLNDKT